MIQSNTNSDDGSTDQEEIDPRLENAFGSKFEDSPMDPSDVGELLANIRNDVSFQHVLEYYAKHYLQDNYTIDPETTEILEELIAKDGISGVFPYRNALVTADDVDLEVGDRVYTKQRPITTNYDDPVIKEYEIDEITENGTDLALRERTHYDLEGNVLEEPRGLKTFRRGIINPNTAQVEYDDSWYVNRRPREDDQ